MSDSSQEYPSRYEDGYEDGYGEGYDVGHSVGYAKGYEDGKEFNKQLTKVDDILDVFDEFFCDLLYVVDENNNNKGYTSHEIRKEFQRWYLYKKSEIQESLEKLEQGYRPWEK